MEAHGLQQLADADGRGHPPVDQHAPDVWTAGRLREATKGLPDDAPIQIGVASDPGDFDGYHDRFLVDYEPAELHWSATTSTPERTEVRHTLFADWPAGRTTYWIDGFTTGAVTHCDPRK